MAQEDLIAAIVREVMGELNGGKGAAPAAPSGNGLDPVKDYPLAKKRPDLVKSPTGKSLDQLTLDAVMKGEVTFADFQITPEALEYQAQIAQGSGRRQLAMNLRRAVELTKVADARLLEMYNALRPNRSTKAELLAMADELEKQYGAKTCAAFVREAAEVYESRNRLRVD